MTTRSGELLASNEKLVNDLGAIRFTDMEKPDFRTFQNDLFYSHTGALMFSTRSFSAARNPP